MAQRFSPNPDTLQIPAIRQIEPNRRVPGSIERAIGWLNGWLGDHLARSGSGLGQTMAFYRNNRALTDDELVVRSLDPEATGKVCVLVHGLGCNESSWRFGAGLPAGDYGRLLQQRRGFSPLYLRYNTGRRVSENGRELAALLDRLWQLRDAPPTELLLIGHSMGGLVVRSACHYGSEAKQPWVACLRHVVYLGSPHLGAPLEKATNLAASLLGVFDTTATRVVREVLDSRSDGIKDLRFGNLVDQDWLDHDPDELLTDRRVSIPWLASARHHRVAGRAVAGAGILGDALVGEKSASAASSDRQSGAPGACDLKVFPGLDHMVLARHPAVYEHIEDRVTANA